jgi:hypothetical protein
MSRQDDTVNGIILTRRGHRVISFIGVLGILLLMGFVGWIENLGM